jgi:hypothetical protein
MGEIVDIGRRIELVPMDPHGQDITIGLYCQELDEGPAFLVHTYSRFEGAQERISFVVDAMCVLGGMVLTQNGMLHFPCWQEHQMACKRVFLEACKLASSTIVEAPPLKILDKKTGLNITVLSDKGGVYQVSAEGEGKDKEKRVAFIAGGLMKLGQMVEVKDTLDKIVFPCGDMHDEMLGLLLIRAPNVRAVLREQDMAASRGVLAAPSQQK